MHWLLHAAERAQMAGLETLQLSAGSSPAESWEHLARVSGMSPRQLAARLAPVMRLAPANLELAEIPARPFIPEKLARKYHVFALRGDDRTVTVATSDPTDLEAEQAISFATGRRVVFELAAHSDITEALSATFSVERAVEALLHKVGAADADADAVRLLEDASPELVSQQDIDAAPIVKLTSLVLSDAVLQGASDIHIEPGSKGPGGVRFRIDGVLRQYMELPPSAVTRIVSRIKVLAKLDIADRLRPQDGRARILVGNKPFDLRISTVPTRDAEKAVVRILRPDTLKSLDEMQLTTPEYLRIRQLLTFREGMVIVTGPTGSGKTTTLYAAVREIANGEVNVMTVEDPVEYEMAGVTQMQVEVKKGFTFATALRSILRQDPDVILVGEIRDAETAAIAAQAALTGHLVLATLHTNDAMSAVTRLAELGLDRATISAILRGSIAQRLIRRVCPDCAQPIVGPLYFEEEELVRTYGTEPTVRAIGCKRCFHTGFLGRLPVVEVALITPSIGDLIIGGSSAGQLQRAAATHGMAPLRVVALERVQRGETTLQEVERVIGDAGMVEETSGGAPAPTEQSVLPRSPSPVLATLDIQSAALRERRTGGGDRRKGRRGD